MEYTMEDRQDALKVIEDRFGLVTFSRGESKGFTGACIDLQCELTRVQGKLDALRALLPEVNMFEAAAKDLSKKYAPISAERIVVNTTCATALRLTTAIRAVCDAQGAKR